MSTRNLPADNGAAITELRDRINTWAGALANCAADTKPANLSFLARDLADMTEALENLEAVR